MAGTAVRIAVVVLLAALIVAAGAALARARPQAMGWREHVEELRRRILVSLATVLGGTIFAFAFRWETAGGVGHPVPAVADNIASQVFARMVADLKPADVQLVVVRPIDGFVAELVIAFGIGVVLAAPILLGQAIGFLRPALQERERRMLRNALLPMTALFLAGGAFAYVYVMPFLLDTLYGYGTALGAAPLLQVSEFVSFTVGLVLVMGLAFQTPVVMVGLSRVGLVEAGTWAKGWRIATVVILLVSALVTDPTVVSQLMVAAPLLLLYATGIGLSALVQRP